MSWFSKHIFNNIHPAAIGAACVTLAGIVTSPEVMAILPAKAAAPLAAVGVVLQMVTRSVSNARTLDGAAKIVARQDAGGDSEPSASEAAAPISVGAQRVNDRMVTPGVPSILPPASKDVHNTPGAGI